MLLQTSRKGDIYASPNEAGNVLFRGLTTTQCTLPILRSEMANLVQKEVPLRLESNQKFTPAEVDPVHVPG